MTYESSSKAEECLNIPASNITRAIKKHTCTHNYYWIYKSDFDHLNDIKFVPIINTTIYQLDPNSKEVIQKYDKIKDAAKKFNVCDDAIGNAIKRHSLSCEYYWIKESNFDQIQNIVWGINQKESREKGNFTILENISTGEIKKFNSIMAACRFLGYKTQSSIRAYPENCRGWKIVH